MNRYAAPKWSDLQISLRTTTTLIALTLAGAALAHTGVKDPDVNARMDGMSATGAASKTLSQMARGQTGYDAAAAEDALADMAREAARVTTLFEPEADDPKSEALPAIWSDWAGFTARAMQLEAAVAAADVSSPEAIGVSMREIGKACGACHQGYRE